MVLLTQSPTSYFTTVTNIKKRCHYFNMGKFFLFISFFKTIRPYKLLVGLSINYNLMAKVLRPMGEMLIEIWRQILL